MEMTSFRLKALGCVSMLSDHMGAYLLHGDLWFRAPGRLAFPIFAYLIAFGFTHTRDTEMYLYRLLLFGALSQFAYNVAQSNYILKDFNVLFSFSLAVITLKLYEKRPSIWIIAGAMAGAQAAGLEFGFNAVLAVFLYYKAKSNRQIVLYTMVLVLSIAIRKAAIVLWSHPEITDMASYLKVDRSIFVIPAAMLAAIFIVAYRNAGCPRGARAKYFFYIFYPAHLLVIGFFVKHPEYIQQIGAVFGWSVP